MISPSSNMQEDATTGYTTAQKSTAGAAHVVLSAGTPGAVDINLFYKDVA